jgi:hypothetical protein
MGSVFSPKVKMPEPSAEELRLREQQQREMERRNTALDREDADRKAREAGDEAARRGGRLGQRSLLSGNWSGFQRGGDVGPA